MKTFLIVGGCIALFIVLAFIAMIPVKGESYSVIAERYSNQCLMRQGIYDGGRSFKDTRAKEYCTLEGTTKAYHEMCQQYPQDCGR